jgi:hypothetical protein
MEEQEWRGSWNGWERLLNYRGEKIPESLLHDHHARPPVPHAYCGFAIESSTDCI